MNEKGGMLGQGKLLGKMFKVRTEKVGNIHWDVQFCSVGLGEKNRSFQPCGGYGAPFNFPFWQLWCGRGPRAWEAVWMLSQHHLSHSFLPNSEHLSRSGRLLSVIDEWMSIWCPGYSGQAGTKWAAARRCQAHLGEMWTWKRARRGKVVGLIG